MIATLIALMVVAGPPDSPKPAKTPVVRSAVARPGPTVASKAEAARKTQARNRLRALNSRRLAGMGETGDAPGMGSSSAGRGNPGGSSMSSGSMMGGGSEMGLGGSGNFGGFPFDSGMGSSIDQQLASTFQQAESAMAAGEAARLATEAMS